MDSVVRVGTLAQKSQTEDMTAVDEIQKDFALKDQA